MYVECWGVVGECVEGLCMLRGTGVYGVHEYVRRERVHEIVLGVIHS